MPAATGHAIAGRSPWLGILLIVGAGIVSAFQVGKAPAALAAIRADLALDLATASWLLSAFAVVGALVGIAIGVAVDHIGARRMALGGLVLQGLASAVGAMAAGTPLLLASRIAEGLGFLAVVVAAPTLIVAIAPPASRARAVAVWSTFMPVGITIVMLGAPLLTALGWRGFWVVNAIVLVAYAMLLAYGTRAVQAQAAPGRSIASDVQVTLGSAGPWLLALLFAAFCAAFFAVFGFLPTLLSDRLGVGLEMASALAGLAVLANVPGNLVGGVLLARGVRCSYLLLAGFGAMAVFGFGILGTDSPGAVIYLSCLAFSVVSGVVPVALFDAAPRHAPRPELVGATVGFLMQGNNAGLMLGPVVAGALAEAAGWPTVVWLIVAIAMWAGVLITVLQTRAVERRGHDRRPQCARDAAV